MKRILIILFIVSVLSLSSSFGQTTDAPLSAVLMGSGTATENFDRWGGGMQVGFESSLANSIGLSARVLYTKWRFGDPTLETIRTNAKWDWFSSKRVAFYLLGGADAWVGDGNNGADLMAGVGFWWKIYTSKNETDLVPFSISILTEVVFADASGEVDNTGQINIGLSFTRPIHK